MVIMIKRTSYIKICHDLAIDKHMIFLVGPRQAGKTTLAQIISASFTNHFYFNLNCSMDPKNCAGNSKRTQGVSLGHPQNKGTSGQV